MRVLGIESSCDETAASVVEIKRGSMNVLSSVVFSQINIHKRYGGVVPEVAARNHIIKILPVIKEAVRPLSPRERGRGEGVDVIAVTAGPGLISSLIIGVQTATTLARAWHKPIVAVNHLAGHIYSAWLEKNKPTFPALALIVSGGHTELVLMRGHAQFKIIGQTRDDAAGEAFDKVAKMLQLGYPGGPAVAAQAAAQVKGKKLKVKKIELPRPMITEDNFDFSFSGIKTSVLYKIQKDENYKKHLTAYCREFQQAVIDVLVHKTLKAAKKYKVKSILLTGGVAANTELRKQLGSRIASELPNVTYHVPDRKYATDNAAMIAAAGYMLVRAKKFTPWQRVKVDANLSL